MCKNHHPNHPLIPSLPRRGVKKRGPGVSDQLSFLSENVRFIEDRTRIISQYQYIKSPILDKEGIKGWLKNDQYLSPWYQVCRTTSLVKEEA